MDEDPNLILNLIAKGVRDALEPITWIHVKEAFFSDSVWYEFKITSPIKPSCQVAASCLGPHRHDNMHHGFGIKCTAIDSADPDKPGIRCWWVELNDPNMFEKVAVIVRYYFPEAI